MHVCPVWKWASFPAELWFLHLLLQNQFAQVGLDLENKQPSDYKSPLECFGSDGQTHPARMVKQAIWPKKKTKSCAVPLSGLAETPLSTEAPARPLVEPYSEPSAVTGARRHALHCDWWGTQCPRSTARLSYLVKLLLLELLGVLRQVLVFIVLPQSPLLDCLPPPFNLWGDK